MSDQTDDESAGEPDAAWWRAQAIALALELSSVKGKYEAELGQLHRDTSEAIEWLQKNLSEAQSARGGRWGRQSFQRRLRAIFNADRQR
jgi:hypothetical protein